jgi:3-deoxy-7-phosphoheptulonate synthase
MIILLEPGAPDTVVDRIREVAQHHEGISVRTQHVQGETLTLTEVHVIGRTAEVPTEAFRAIEGVRIVARVSAKYRMIGRHADADEERSTGWEVNGVRFDDDQFHLCAGLCAVDTQEHVEQTMKAVAAAGLTTTRMGAYKPRTSPYDFQGHGARCLPGVFEAAGKYGIKLISMEVTAPQHVEEIQAALEHTGQPTSVMLQIGTRNAQNFELLKAVGQQRELPVLFKRGMGITLEESLNAAEYVAASGNPHIVFCLRGVKSHLGDPHRNLVDFGMVPVVRRLTRLPVCVDPSHSVGRPFRDPDGIPDIFHVLGQGILAGASMGLVDLHPHPSVALCDGPQALTLDQLPWLIEHTQRAREAYVAVRDLARAQG